MVRTASIFSQLLRFFPQNEFDRLVAKHGAERATKGFTSWSQFVAMLFCHLAGAESLREICAGLGCCLGKLRHLGLRESPNKSTLSYANAHRPAAMFEELFWNTLGRFRALGQLGPGRPDRLERRPAAARTAQPVDSGNGTASGGRKGVTWSENRASCDRKLNNSAAAQDASALFWTGVPEPVIVPPLRTPLKPPGSPYREAMKPASVVVFRVGSWMEPSRSAA